MQTWSNSLTLSHWSASGKLNLDSLDLSFCMSCPIAVMHIRKKHEDYKAFSPFYLCGHPRIVSLVPFFWMHQQIFTSLMYCNNHFRNNLFKEQFSSLYMKVNLKYLDEDVMCCFVADWVNVSLMLPFSKTVLIKVNINIHIHFLLNESTERVN